MDVDYQSRLANFSFRGENNNLFFSHDSNIDDNYLTLNTQGSYSLWSNGPEFFATAAVDNTSRNSASNGLADLVSGDTVQSKIILQALAITLLIAVSPYNQHSHILPVDLKMKLVIMMVSLFL